MIVFSAVIRNCCLAENPPDAAKHRKRNPQSFTLTNATDYISPQSAMLHTLGSDPRPDDSEYCPRPIAYLTTR